MFFCTEEIPEEAINNRSERSSYPYADDIAFVPLSNRSIISDFFHWHNDMLDLIHRDTPVQWFSIWSYYPEKIGTLNNWACRCLSEQKKFQKRILKNAKRNIILSSRWQL